MADIAAKSISFQIVAVYVHNDQTKRVYPSVRTFPSRFDSPSLNESYNPILNPKIDRKLGASGRSDDRSLVDLIDESTDTA